MIFYTDKFIPPEFQGRSYGPVAFIRPERRNDTGLIVHEKIHIWQFWGSMGVLTLMSRLSKEWLLKVEVEAFKAQNIECIRIGKGDRSEALAKLLCTNYGINITQAEAQRRILQ